MKNHPDKKELLKEIGENIGRLLNENKPDECRKALAAHLNNTPQAVGNIIHGKADISISRIFDIAVFFNIPFQQILRIDNNKVFHINNHNNENCTINTANSIYSNGTHQIDTILSSFSNTIKDFFIASQK